MRPQANASAVKARSYQRGCGKASAQHISRTGTHVHDGTGVSAGSAAHVNIDIGG